MTAVTVWLENFYYDVMDECVRLVPHPTSASKRLFASLNIGARTIFIGMQRVHYAAASKQAYVV